MNKTKNTIHITRKERELVLRALESYAKQKGTSPEDKTAASEFIEEMEQLIHES